MIASAGMGCTARAESWRHHTQSLCLHFVFFPPLTCSMWNFSQPMRRAKSQMKRVRQASIVARAAPLRFFVTLRATGEQGQQGCLQAIGQAQAQAVKNPVQTAPT